MKDLKALFIVKTSFCVKGSSLVALVIDGKYCLNSPSNIVESRQKFHRNGRGFYSAREVYTTTCQNQHIDIMKKWPRLQPVIVTSSDK
jgi:hypothetical protein